MENEQSIYMTRSGDCWRMDKDTYLRFIKHVHHYFTECGNIPEEVLLRLAYAEIPVRSMDVLCFLFGGYSRDNKELVLMEFFPGKVFFPWEKEFVLNLYTENNELISVLMDIKESFKQA